MDQRSRRSSPACRPGVSIDIDAINRDLARRQGGYGRGGRQKIEHDTAQILSGVRFSQTLGTPITLQVVNDDFANWTDRMAPSGEAPDDLKRETCPRPGHADLVGMLKIATDDARDILERSSARETAARVAAGGIAKALLAELGVEVYSYVRRHRHGGAARKRADRARNHRGIRMPMPRRGNDAGHEGTYR